MLPCVFRHFGKNCTLLAKEGDFVCNFLNYQSVRWRRKPRWLPVAKSKMFRVPERPNIPEEEKIELRRLTNNYRTEMKSIRAFFSERTKESLTGEDVIAEQERLEEEEHKRCLQLNEEWNANVAALRLARLAREKELELESIIKNVEEVNRREKERKEQLEALVRQEKEKSKYFITRENIDQAIEKALADVVDYDYAIDIEGNKYMGRHTKPSTNKQKIIDEVST